ncbi:glycosyltransferase family 4 protein [Marinibacterium sp. SX1]|uniref:glycosyltransferase family 4 protein n=1 Tax=Marinibacterium sp. SX1 TaxID=3388424 RepID=UPI003D1774C8
MPGDGTKLAITTNNPVPGRLLDLTRSLRRAGRQPTGVDRVELAYLDHLLERDAPLFGLVRTGAGYLLLDEEGLRAAQSRLHGAEPWGRADVLSSLFRKRPEMVRRAESDLRRLAVGRCRRAMLATLLQAHLAPGTPYLNTGHSGLNGAALAAIRQGTQGRIAVLIHDTIPLDHPEYQRPGTAGTFRRKLEAAGAHADLLICNSHFTETRVRAHLDAPPDILVAPLGVTPARPDPAALPPGLPPARPFFVALGTIEPRKGHDLLLDTWAALARDRPADEMPGLVICGSRGWNNEAVFARLDALPDDGVIRECPGLSDGAVAALLQASCGLLFPSRAEGFGLPPLEAAMLGVPVVAAPLPVYEETLNDIRVYLVETESYLWRNIVDRLVTADRGNDEAGMTSGFDAMGWSDHFDVVCKNV